MDAKIRLYHKLSLYAVVAVAFGCVFAGGTLTLPTVGLFSVFAAASWFADTTRLTDEAYDTWWNVLIVGVLVATIGLVWAGGDTYLRAGVRFVTVLTIIKLLSRSGSRDELQLYALSFLAIAAATAVNTGVTFGLLFGLYVLAGTFSLALFHLRVELDNRRRAPLLQSIPFDAQYVTVLAVLSVGIFASSMVIFFGFPRIGLGFFAQSSRASDQMSGFSESVELGSHGVVRDNPTVAIRVEFPDGKPSGYSDFHWRMITFDKYDGSGWKRTLREDTDPLPVSEGTYDLSELYADSLRAGAPRELPAEMKLYLEPLDSNFIPTLWPTRELTFSPAARDSLPMSPRSGSLKRDRYGDVRHTVASDMGLPYTLYPGRRPSPAELREKRRPFEINDYLRHFLQLPDDVDRIRRLAERVTAEAEGPYAQATAIAQYLRSNYDYTTDLPKLEGDDPIESFLFSARRGHCEYYASAMVLMLRTLDIPARMVNGFLGGKWNSVGGYLTVRQGDAHSWVEVYLPGYWWVQMDPTPAGGGTSGGSLTSWFRDSYDTLRMWWLQWVIEYDLETQIGFLKTASKYFDTGGDGGASGATADSGEEGGGLDLWALITWGGFALVFLGGAWRTRRLHPRYDRRRLVVRALVWSGVGAGWAGLIWEMAAADAGVGAAVGLGGAAAGAAWATWSSARDSAPVTRLFKRIEHAGRQSGLAREPGEAPGHYLERVREAVPAVEREVELFRHRYHAARFGGRSMQPRARRATAEAARAVVRALNADSRKR